MAGKQEADSDPGDAGRGAGKAEDDWEKIKDAERGAGEIPESVEELKRALVAANERAMACFLMVQHLRKELPVEEAPPPDFTLDVRQTLNLVRDYRRRVREAKKLVPAPLVKCSNPRCKAMVPADRMKTYRGHYQHQNGITQVFCRGQCITESHEHWRFWRIQNQTR
jgi:hypothetical protein